MGADTENVSICSVFPGRSEASCSLRVEVDLVMSFIGNFVLQTWTFFTYIRRQAPTMSCLCFVIIPIAPILQISRKDSYQTTRISNPLIVSKGGFFLTEERQFVLSTASRSSLWSYLLQILVCRLGNWSAFLCVDASGKSDLCM